jgi:Gpi18-like mannosyltransferase
MKKQLSIKFSKKFFIFALFFLTLIIRILPAPFFKYFYDVNCFRIFLAHLMEIKNFYDLANLYFNLNISLIGYPLLPIPIYLFGFFGFFYKLLISKDFSNLNPTLIFFLKIPAIISDFLIAFLIFKTLAKNFSKKIAYLVSFSFLFNPAVIFLSSFWGQLDSLVSLFLLLTFIFLAKKNYRLAWLFIIISILTKAQSLFFLPLVFFLDSYQNNFKKFLKDLLFASFIFFLFLLPFNKAILKILSYLLSGPGFYPYLSIYAFNFWHIPQIFKKRLLLDTPFTLLIGLSIFSFFYFLILKKILKNFNFLNLCFSFTLIGFSAFLFLTEMHERYLYYALPFLTILLVKNKKMWFPYLTTTLSFFINLVSVSSQNLFLSIWQFSFLFIILNLFNFTYLFYQFLKTN